ncbi:MAG: phosphate acyltransferase, partial [Flavobacteriales bacterium]
LDPRLISTVAPAVAKAAIDSKIAQKTIKDWGAYASELDKRLGLDNKLIRNVTERAKKNPKRVVFAEADHYRILKAAQIVYDEGIAKPILLGKKHIIEALIEENHLDLEGVPIVDPKSDEERKRRLEYADLLWAKRRRRGFTEFEARKIMRERNWFGAAMVQTGDADAMISGITRNYRDTIRPALQLIGRDEDVNLIAGMYILIDKRGPIFFADTTVNFKPTARDLVDITVLAAKTVKRFKLVPRIALLSYSNFGSSEGEDAEKVREAVAILHKEYPGLVVDGELQANFALNNEMMMDKFPFSKLVNKSPNVLIFPNLAAGNIAYKLMQEMSDTETVGPLLMGMKKAVHILQLGSGVREIVNMVTIAVTDAQTREK